MNKQDIKTALKQLYPSFQASDLYDKLIYIIKSFKITKPDYLRQWDEKLEKSWYKSSDHIFYVLYADLFCADELTGEKLEGISKRINYFKELGVTNIHILPCLKSSGDAGFAVDDYRQIDPDIGNINQFKELIKKLHENNIKITFDLVLNHTSDNHIWAKEVKKGSKKYLDYYIRDKTKSGKSWPLVPDIFPEFAPGHWDYVPEIDEYLWASFYSRYPYKNKKYNDFAQWDLNYKNPEVLFEMIKNMLYLANLGVDVFRFDAIPHMWKRHGTDCFSLNEVYKIVNVFYFALHEVARVSDILVEASVETELLKKYFQNGNTMHLAYNFSLMPALWYAVTFEDTCYIKQCLRLFKDIPKNCELIIFDENHDEVNFSKLKELVGERKAGEIFSNLFIHFTKGRKGLPFRFKEGIDKYSTAISGTRWSLLGGDLTKNVKQNDLLIKKVLLMDAFKLSIGGIPMFYQGEEIGISNDYSYQKDPVKKVDSRFIKRIKIYDSMREKRNIRNTKEYKIFNKLKYLVQIRKKYEAFGYGKFKLTEDKNMDLLVFERYLKRERIFVILNFSNKKQEYTLTRNYYDLIEKKNVGKKYIEIEPFGFKWFISR